MKNKIYALGFFDGVHLGHQALLSACVALAEEKNALPCAITFENHPMSAFTTEYPPLLTQVYDRGVLLRRFGMEKTLLLGTDKEIMSTSWQAFLEDLCDLGAVGFVCGHDFRFGHRGEGDPEKLKAFCEARGLPCVVVPEQLLDGVRISSSHIRALLEAGELAEAERFLGHRHRFTGRVVHGRALGRTIGVPTANLEVPEKQILPKNGVYACLARTKGKEYAAVTNIGSRPTVGGRHVTVEAWLLDFEGDLYDDYVNLEFIKFLRPERKFDSLEELKAAIEQNARETREIWKEEVKLCGN